jgi:hypothetical protein
MMIVLLIIHGLLAVALLGDHRGGGLVATGRATFKFIRDPANRKSVVKTIVETTDTPAGIVQQTLALFFEPERYVLPVQGEINVNGLGQVIAFMAEARPCPLPTVSSNSSIFRPPA